MSPADTITDCEKGVIQVSPYFFTRFFLPRVCDRSLFTAEGSIPSPGGGASEHPPRWGTRDSPPAVSAGAGPGRAGAGQDGLGSTAPADSTPPRLHSLCGAGPVHGGSIRSGVQLDGPGLLLRHLRPHTALRGADGAAAAPLRRGPSVFLRRGKLGGKLPCAAVPPRAAGERWCGCRTPLRALRAPAGTARDRDVPGRDRAGARRPHPQRACAGSARTRTAGSEAAGKRCPHGAAALSQPCPRKSGHNPSPSRWGGPGTAARRSCCCAIPRIVQGLEGVPVRGMGWNRMGFKVPSNPAYSVMT